MSETIVESSPAAVAAEKKVAKKNSGAGAVKKLSSVPNHLPTQQMVDASIKMLKERGGSSLIAIKKYIATTYKVDAQKLAPFIKKYLKSAVASGKLIQTKGNGASGSFKLSAVAGKESKNPKAKSVEKKKTTTVTAASKKKSAAGKKVASSNSAAGEKKGKKSAAKVEAPKVEKKKNEKIKSKVVKKAEIVKAKVPKAKEPSAAATKSKVAKPKAAAPLSKAKKSVAAIKKPAATAKKITAKK